MSIYRFYKALIKLKGLRSRLNAYGEGSILRIRILL